MHGIGSSLCFISLYVHHYAGVTTWILSWLVLMCFHDKLFVSLFLTNCFNVLFCFEAVAYDRPIARRAGQHLTYVEFGSITYHKTTFTGTYPCKFHLGKEIPHNMNLCFINFPIAPCSCRHVPRPRHLGSMPDCVAV